MIDPVDVPPIREKYSQSRKSERPEGARSIVSIRSRNAGDMMPPHGPAIQCQNALRAFPEKV